MSGLGVMTPLYLFQASPIILISQSFFNLVLPANTAHKNPAQRLSPLAANELWPNGSENGGRGPDCDHRSSKAAIHSSVSSALRWKIHYEH